MVGQRCGIYWSRWPIETLGFLWRRRLPDSQPNKPDAKSDSDDAPAATNNQSSVTPDDYPDGSGGKPNYKDRDKA